MNIFSIIARMLNASTRQQDTVEPRLEKELNASQADLTIRPVSQPKNEKLPNDPSITAEGQIVVAQTETDRIYSAIRERIPVTLIHGRAGTGKTTLIRRFINETHFNHVIIAPTGVAALNAGGQTIHSFFGLPPRIVNLDEIEPKNRLRTIIRRVDFIAIDEISMVRADLLDAVDHAMRINRGEDKPFGGVPMLLVGDFLQLPPIVERADSEILKNLGYESHFAFAAKCMQNVIPNIIELTTVHRQTEIDFIELLGKLRIAEDVGDTVATLNRLCHRPHRASEIPVILTARVASAETYNMRGLSALPGNKKTYIGTVTGDFPTDKRLPAPEFLDLKVGSRVMLVKNDSQKRWVNGTLATVIRLGATSLWACIDETRLEFEITVESWENIRYEWDQGENRVKANVIGTYSQIPVIPAWAITIHKAQGLTLSDVRIDLGAGAFSEGQAYVALSRARSLDGLSLAKALRPGDVRVSADLVDGVKRMTEQRRS